jgi:hypothetical protein
VNEERVILLAIEETVDPLAITLQFLALMVTENR